MHIDSLVASSYERFLLFQHHIKTVGLYYGRGEYYIYCPEISSGTKSNDGTELQEWFSNNKIIGTRIKLVSSLPENVVNLDKEMDSRKIPLSGYLITRSDVEKEIDLLIPSIFPDYAISFTADGVTITFIEDVPQESFAELERIFAEANFQLSALFNGSGKTSDESFKIANKKSIRNLRQTLPKNIIEAMELDKDRWLDNRKILLTHDQSKSVDLRSDSLKPSNLRCIVNCALSLPDDIRNYLSIYQEVGLIMPEKNGFPNILKHLNVTSAELLELVALKKVHLYFPQSLEVYDHTFLADLLERNSDRAHLPNTLKSMVISESKHRNPLYLPLISIQEKRVLLSSIDRYLSDTIEDPEFLNICKTKLASVGHGWSSIASFINQTDVNGLGVYGIVDIIADILEYKLKKDIKLGFLLAAPSVDLAAATRSILIPPATDQLNLVSYSSTIANIYSGIPGQDWVIEKPIHANFVAKEILTVGEHVPVLEFAKSFSGSEISRFHKLVIAVTKHQETPEDIGDTIESYNYFVKKYENRNRFLNLWDISGFVLSGAAKISGLTFPKWLVSSALKKLQKQSPAMLGLGVAIDRLESLIVGTMPDAILISRMRNKLKDKI